MVRWRGGNAETAVSRDNKLIREHARKRGKEGSNKCDLLKLADVAPIADAVPTFRKFVHNREHHQHFMVKSGGALPALICQECVQHGGASFILGADSFRDLVLQDFRVCSLLRRMEEGSGR